MASKVNYACTVLDKQYTTCGFRETQYMSPSKSLLAISSAKDRGPQVGERIWHIWNFPQSSPNHRYMLQSIYVYRQSVIQDVYRQEPFQKVGRCHCLLI